MVNVLASYAARVGEDCEEACPVITALKVIGGKWKPALLYYLMDGPKRFSALRRFAEGISERTLSLQLKELEADGMIVRHDFGEVPPRVEYSLAPLGTQAVPMLKNIETWGGLFLESRGMRPRQKPET